MRLLSRYSAILMCSLVCLTSLSGCGGSTINKQASTNEVVADESNKYPRLYFNIDYKSNDTNPDTYKEEDKEFRNNLISKQPDEDLVRVPITRVNSYDIIIKATELGLIDCDLTEGGLANCLKDLSTKTITRREYVKLYNKIVLFGQFAPVGCCMGTAPDLTQVKGDKDRDAFETAALGGYLCTREGARPDDNLTKKELALFNTKLIKSIPYTLSDQEVYLPITGQQFKDTYKDQSPVVKLMKEAEADTYATGWNLGTVLEDTNGNILLDGDATYLEVLIQAVNLLDQRVIYTKVNSDENICIPCIETSVDTWYEDLYKARDNGTNLYPTQVGGVADEK